MRRPIVFITAAFATGIWLCSKISIFGVLGLSLICAAPIYVFWRKSLIFLFLLCSLAGATYYQQVAQQENPLSDHVDQVVTVWGRGESLEIQEGQGHLLLDCTRWKSETEGGSLSGKILVVFRLPVESQRNHPSYFPDGISTYSELVGKDMEVAGKVAIPTGARNPGQFDYQLYLKTRDVDSILYGSIYRLAVVGEGNRLTCALSLLKDRYAQGLSTVMDSQNQGLLLGMLFGDKSTLGDDLYEAFQKNGTAHILAVSGIHVSILYVYVNRLFRKRRSLLATATSLVILLLYAALASFSPSVMRAVAMIGLHLLAKHQHRPYDLLCCAAFSALLMMLVNPFSLFNPGFQLSYLAVISMAFLVPFAESKFTQWTFLQRHRLLIPVLKPFVPVVAIQIGMMPASAYLFHLVSMSGFLMNLPVIFLSTLAIPLGILSLFLSFLGGDLFAFVATGLDWMVSLLIHLNVTVGDFPLSSFLVTRPSLGLLFICYGSLFFVTSELFWSLHRSRNTGTLRTIVLWILLVSILGFLMDEGQNAQVDITFVDVGQGDCIYVNTPSGKHILIDGGGSTDFDVGKKILLPFLLSRGVNRIDLMLATHLHEDHFGGLVSLSQLLPVNQFGLFEGYGVDQAKLLSEIGLGNEQLLYLVRGDIIPIEDGVFFEILAPEPGDEKEYMALEENKTDENKSCLLIKLHDQGHTILITGDLGEEGERAALEAYGTGINSKLRSDILKVGHHGSRHSTTDDFLAAVDPEIAVIQVGRNNFGHPHGDVIEKMKRNGIIVYRNDQEGAILMQFLPEEVRIRTMLKTAESDLK